MKSTFLMSTLCLVGMACSKSNSDSPVPQKEESTITIHLFDALNQEPLDSVLVMRGKGHLTDLGYTQDGSLKIKPESSSLLWFSKPGYQLHYQNCEKSDSIYLKPYIPFRLEVETGILHDPIWLYGSFNESSVQIYSDTSLNLNQAAMSWVSFRFMHDGLLRKDSMFLSQRNQVFHLRMP